MDGWANEQLEHAKEIQSQLDRELSKAQEKCAIYNKQAAQQKLLQEQQEAERNRLVQRVNDTEEVIEQLQNQVDQYQQETSGYLSECEEIQLDRKAQELKLRKFIAFSKQCTQIRWNYDAQPEHLLQGQVSVDNEIRPIELDTTQLSKFEIANTLWGIME